MDPKDQLLKKLNSLCPNTLMETLQIEFVDVEDEMVVARMPVTNRVHQPDGVLHGGATVALAESVGSAASHLFLGGQDVQVRGIEISANHLKSVKNGYVFAQATVIHKGRSTQLWQIRITDDQDRLISLVKLTTITLSN
ncbi:PaaI family thioesterase [Aureitalea marina]|uniref:Thioesterase n=1 Tax=Aureitalea marina TaxID=930804 RepID=A0A2S7KNK9_9FLAO|nr:PaaI family thioesterase [Aureitalea marina]PQB04201.1 thioesterase [Aureitalea marina]